MDDVEVRVVRLPHGSTYELEEYSWSTPGRHDYKSEGFTVERVVDRDDNEFTLEWGDESLEVFPGCVTTSRDGRRSLRVSSAACPMRALHAHWFHYSGSHPDHGSSWRTRTWYHFELAGDSEE